MNKKIVLTGGGTGGHIMPNLALIPHLTAKFDIHYIGTSQDREIVTTHSPQVIFHTIDSVKLVRPVLHLSNALIPIKLHNCKKAAIKLLEAINPKCVFSKGGYVSLPVMVAAEKLNIPYIIHESDYSLGMSNWLCNKKASAVLGAFESSIKNLKNGKHTGTPLRDLKGDKNRLDLSNFDKSKPILLVVGGSSGARTINNCIKLNLDLLCNHFNILHITGKADADNTRRRGYLQVPFAYNMADYIAAADFVITRAGANALFEFVSQHKPTLAIPLPKGASRGDQVQNAKYFLDKKCILVLQQEFLTIENLVNKLNELLKSKDFLIQQCKSQTNIDGTKQIVDIITSTVFNEQYLK